MPAKTRREVNLDHGRITVNCPPLMSDAELAEVLAAFGEEMWPPDPGHVFASTPSNTATLGKAQAV
jgi:hypothetical protein